MEFTEIIKQKLLATNYIEYSTYLECFAIYENNNLNKETFYNLIKPFLNDSLNFTVFENAFNGEKIEPDLMKLIIKIEEDNEELLVRLVHKLPSLFKLYGIPQWALILT